MALRSEKVKEDPLNQRFLRSGLRSPMVSRAILREFTKNYGNGGICRQHCNAAATTIQ